MAHGEPLEAVHDALVGPHDELQIVLLAEVTDTVRLQKDSITTSQGRLVGDRVTLPCTIILPVTD